MLFLSERTAFERVVFSSGGNGRSCCAVRLFRAAVVWPSMSVRWPDEGADGWVMIARGFQEGDVP
jgi:hypothetical protein